MIKKLFELKGKTALVTGGSQGIGKAISLAFAEYGANIVINYRSNSELAEQAATEIRSLGVDCHSVQCDLARPDAAKIIATFFSNNSLAADILVLNASVQIRKPWNDITLEEYDLQLNTNLRSSLFLIQEFYPAMQQKQWGRILTIGSVQQVRPHQQMLVYAASKTAQESFVRSLAPQFATCGVTINNLAPGAIATGRNEEALSDEKYKAEVEAKIPVGYIGQADDCVPAALLLCSRAGKYITGQNIYVDGGMGLNH